MSETKIKPYEKPENIINPNSEFSIEVQNLRQLLMVMIYMMESLILKSLLEYVHRNHQFLNFLQG